MLKWVKYWWNCFYWGKDLADLFVRAEYELDKLTKLEK
jgi:hypothetical protein